MAEYIDSDYISKCAISNLIKDIQGDIERRFECYRLPSPTADVIPLEKIKKAMTEIENLSGQSCMVSDGVVNEVLDILDKLIESEG